MNSGEKIFFYRKDPASFSDECNESGEFLYDLRFLAVKFLFSPHSTEFLQKKKLPYTFYRLKKLVHLLRQIKNSSIYRELFAVRFKPFLWKIANGRQ